MARDVADDPARGDPDDDVPRIAVRVPGPWTRPKDLSGALPAGYRLEPWRLKCPDGASLYVDIHGADAEFPRIFRRAAAARLTPAERRAIDGYRVNVCLGGPGGSPETARRMVGAAAALVRAGGAGVFVDNSGLVRTAAEWLAIDGRPGGDDSSALDGFVATIGGEHEIFSLGMHVFGLRDAVMERGGAADADHFVLLAFLDYTFSPEEPICDGDFVGDLSRQFRLCRETCRHFKRGSPMHNPYGRWRLQPIPDALPWHGPS